MILANTFRPMSSNELRDLLAVRAEAEDYATSRIPSMDTILELCMPLVEVERVNRGSSADNPTIKMCHKTVDDFFNQDPKVITNPDLRKFFATSSQASQELGLNCLTYLSYQRYQERGLDLTSLLSKNPVPEDHAFLRYAATFWAHHLMSPTTEPRPRAVTEACVNFVQSPAFWNCMSVQSHVTPYTFATFVKHKGGVFDMQARGGDADSFGVPLPSWLDEVSPELVRSLYCFVDEWREVLTTSPGGLDLCPPLRKFGTSCVLTPLQKPKSMRVSLIGEATGIAGELSEMCLLSVHFRGKTAFADVLCRAKQDGGWGALRRVEVPLFSKKKKPSEPLLVNLPVDTGDSAWTFHSLQQAGSPARFEAWKLDPDTLELKRICEDEKSVPEQNLPLSISQNSAGKRRGAWEIVSTQTLESAGVGATSSSILHASWRKRKPTAFLDACRIRAAEDSDNDTDSSDDVFQVADQQDADSDSDSDSDDESDVETDLETERETDQENDSSEIDYEFEPEDRLPTDCLVMVPYSGQPLRHMWTSPPQKWAKVTCAMHPTLPLIAVTHTRRQLEVISFPSGAKTTKHLPEVADLEAVPPGSLRGELRRISYSVWPTSEY